MITVKELADRLKVSQRLIYKLVSAGELECYRIGATIRFTEDQIENYLDRSLNGQDPFQVTDEPGRGSG